MAGIYIVSNPITVQMSVLVVLKAQYLICAGCCGCDQGDSTGKRGRDPIAVRYHSIELDAGDRDVALDVQGSRQLLVRHDVQ